MSRRQSVITAEQWPRPEDFPIGSAESRAAARAMLDSRKKKEYWRVPIHYMGFGQFEYIVDRTGIVKTIGRVPTLEEFLAHPAIRGCNIQELSDRPRQVKQQAQQILESDQPRVAPQAPETPRVDPLAAVHRRRFNG